MFTPILVIITLFLIYKLASWYVKNSSTMSSSPPQNTDITDTNEPDVDNCESYEDYEGHAARYSYPPLPKEIKEKIYLARIANAISGKRFDVSKPQSFKDKYGYHWKKTVKLLLKDNYLYLENNYSSLKISELKDILKHHNLKISGTKQQLIDRLNTLNTKVDLGYKKTYAPTDLGLQLITAYQPFVWSESSAFFDIQDEELYFFLTKLKEYGNYQSDYEAMCDLLKLRFKKSIIEKEWHHASGLMSSLYSFQMSRKKWEESLKSFTKYFYCTISGLSFNDFVYPINKIELYPFQRKDLNRILQELNIPDDAIKTICFLALDEIVNEWPFSYFKKETVYEFLLDFIESLDIDLTSYESLPIPSQFRYPRYLLRR
ncbi:SAP domain-containing protein [Veillonella magna]|uniref:SAP domain-containing protein n=1 Tax=Veillonella magna TaxID=464322 RepID=UPI0026DB28B6|nr:SAP domain-containing protein [Veillonella magna]